MNQAEDTGERWGHSEHELPGTWVGDFRTREAAIEDGRTYYSGAFYVQRGNVADPMQFLPDASDILDHAWQQADSEVGEVAEDWPHEVVSEEALKELDELIASWAAKHLPMCKFWVGDASRKPERIGPPPVVTDTDGSFTIDFEARGAELSTHPEDPPGNGHDGD